MIARRCLRCGGRGSLPPRLYTVLVLTLDVDPGIVAREHEPQDQHEGRHQRSGEEEPRHGSRGSHRLQRGGEDQDALDNGSLRPQRATSRSGEQNGRSGLSLTMSRLPYWGPGSFHHPGGGEELDGEGGSSSVGAQSGGAGAGARAPQEGADESETGSAHLGAAPVRVWQASSPKVASRTQ
jgi:hypothetical protein